MSNIALHEETVMLSNGADPAISLVDRYIVDYKYKNEYKMETVGGINMPVSVFRYRLVRHLVVIIFGSVIYHSRKQYLDVSM